MPNSRPPPAADAKQSAIHLVAQQWLIHFRRGNAADLAMLYTANGQLMPAYSPAICGRPAIQAFWQGCFDMGIGAMLRAPEQIDWQTDTLNEVGAYRILSNQQRLLDIGYYVLVWKAHHGQWQIHRDSWTSNLPATR